MANPINPPENQTLHYYLICPNYFSYLVYYLVEWIYRLSALGRKIDLLECFRNQIIKKLYLSYECLNTLELS